ncbi:alpha/beta hydrolase [Niallia sp. FSL W8-0951]|uniref:alpha/beta hydrolase n=1 Tax=Niallia sp. FSL W8-0951 TaxID=2954639 RepID=UPI0030FA2A5F
MLIKQVNVNSGSLLKAYILDNSAEFANISKRPAILIFPGGGYYGISDREAEPIAMAYLAEGYNAFILHYSVGKESNFTNAFSDAEKALSLIHENADEWNIETKKVAVIGFSAGGHLAASLGTMGKLRPSAMLLGYPCILEKWNRGLAFSVPSLEKEVDNQTPPAFLFATFEDELVPVENTISFMQALNEHKIAFESHIFQKGVHGLSLAKGQTSSGLKKLVNNDFSKWFALSVSWLKNIIGDFPADKDSIIPNARDVNEYSIEVRIESLLNNPECRELLQTHLPILLEVEAQESAKDYSIKIVNQGLPNALSENQLNELNDQLKKIKVTE